MKLNLAERFGLLKIIPKEGSYLTLKIVKDLTEALSLSEEDFEEFGIKTDENNLTTWNLKGIERKEIKIGEKAREIIIKALEDANKKMNLTFELYDLYEREVLKLNKGETKE